jgi:hypothetical protein
VLGGKVIMKIKKQRVTEKRIGSTKIRKTVTVSVSRPSKKKK